MNQIVFAAATDPNLLAFVLLGVSIFIIGSVLRYFKQPYIIAYILAGVMLGKHGFKILTDEGIIQAMGEFGLILLLFFIGMETSLPNFIKNWKIPTFGTLLQIGGSVLMVAFIGSFLGWNYNRIIVLGFVISLSSSAVVVKLLQDSQESDSPIGQNIISILIMQDILIVPMLIATNYLGGNLPPTHEIILQLTGGVLIVGVIIWIIRKKEFDMPFGEKLRHDHELQVIFAFTLCFGCALLTALFGLSAALGSFVGGMIVNSARSTEWFHDSLHSFRIIFVAIFFVSVGMLIDITFLMANWQIVLFILIAVYIGNHFINAAVIYFFGRSWQMSLYGGAMLAQIGELSFVIASSALFLNIISEYSYQITIIVISLTLLISPFWVSLTKKLVNLEREKVKG